MRPSARRIADYMVITYAAVFPWDVFQYVPFVGLHLSEMLAVVLFLAWVKDAVADRTRRLRFELTWPVLGLVGAYWLRFIVEGGSVPVAPMLAIGLFVSAERFGSHPGVRDASLRLMGISAGCVALLTLTSRVLPLTPTAYSVDAPLTATFARDLYSGVFILLLCLIAVVFLAQQQGQDRRLRVFLAGNGAVIYASLIAMALPIMIHQLPWPAQDVRHTSFLEGVIALLIFWLAARVIAKLTVARIEYRRRHAELFIGMAVGAVILYLLLPIPARPFHAFLLGLAAGAARPWGEQTELPRRYWAAFVPIVLLAPINLLHVFAENSVDPRNYDAAARRDLQGGDFDLLRRRMAYFQDLSPGEVRTDYWRARAALEQDDPLWASQLFARSLARPENRVLLGSVNEGEIRDMLRRFRIVASSGERSSAVIAHERALAAAGQHDGLMALIDTLTEGNDFDWYDGEAGPLRRAAARILEDAVLEEELGRLGGPQLLRLFGTWGASVDHAPSYFPSENLPFVAWAWETPEQVTCTVIAGALDVTGDFRPAKRGHTAVSAIWADWRRDEQNRWKLGLIAPEAPQASPLAEFTLAGEHSTLEEALSTSAVVLHEPAIRVWVP